MLVYIGITITKHTPRESTRIILYMNMSKRTLSYKPFAGWTPRKKGIKLNQLSSVERGKASLTFKSDKLETIPDNLCFSLILTNGSSFDLEANSTFIP